MKWTKCSEKLPPCNIWVMTYGYDIDYCDFGIARVSGNTWSFLEPGCGCCAKDPLLDEVKYWMPLPEAPNEVV